MEARMKEILDAVQEKYRWADMCANQAGTLMDAKAALSGLTFPLRRYKWEKGPGAPSFAVSVASVQVNVTVADVRHVGIVIRRLRAAGYKRMSMRTDELSQSVSWTFKGPRGEIILYANLPHGEEAVCKYVQVGTKTVEQPIFELRCGEEMVKEEEVEHA